MSLTVRPASNPWCKAMSSFAMLPAAAKAAMGTMACWRAVSVEEAAGAVDGAGFVPLTSFGSGAPWVNVLAKLSATANRPE